MSFLESISDLGLSNFMRKFITHSILSGRNLEMCIQLETSLWENNMTQAEVCFVDKLTFHGA